MSSVAPNFTPMTGPEPQCPVITNEASVLAMLKEDMTDIKLAIKEHQIDTREEFRRIRDKIDVLNAQVGLDAKTAAVAMKELETRQVESAKYSGRIAGAIAGFVTAVIASAVAALLKLFVIPH